MKTHFHQLPTLGRHQCRHSCHPFSDSTFSGSLSESSLYVGGQTVSVSSFIIDSCSSRQSWLRTGCKGEPCSRLMSRMQSPFLIDLHCSIAEANQTLLDLSTLTLFSQASNSQTTFPRPESSPAPTPSLTTTTSKMRLTEVEEAPQTETTLEFAPTEAFPRLDCGGRGFYQVGWSELFFTISIRRPVLTHRLETRAIPSPSTDPSPIKMQKLFAR